jgi:PAS domain S-box-containing protein
MACAGPAGARRQEGVTAPAALAGLLALVTIALAVVVWLLSRARAPGGGAAADERYHQLVDRLPATVAVWDRHTRIVSFCSAQMEQLTGEPAELWLGADGMRRFRSRVHPDDLADPERWRPADDPLPSQYRWSRSDGTTIWVRELLSPIAGRDVLAILFDVTAEVRAREERDAHLLRYQTLIEQTPVVTYVTDQHGVVTYVSRQCERMLGYTADQLVKEMDVRRRRPLIFHPDDVPLVTRRQSALLAGRVDAVDEAVRMVASDGSPRFAQIIARRMLDASGTVMGTQGVVVDLTRLRAAEQRSHRVLGALVTAAEDERARIATELHDDTVQVMTALLMQVRVMLRGDAGLGEFEQQLADALDRTRRLMFELRPQVLERSGLAAAVDELAAEGPWRQAEVAIDIPRQSQTLEAIAYRAIRELIVNARKHSGANRLIVQGWDDGARLRFVVEDDGVGFDVDRALDRDRMRMHIGLDATGERLNLAGGSLQIRSALGSGARFEIMLPAAPRGVDDPAL